MFKILTTVFVVCMIAYLPFSRYPDFFHGEYTSGKVILAKDFASDKAIKMVTYKIDGDSNTYQFKPQYPALRKVGESVKVIYDTQIPKNAAVYSLFGYWLSLKEMLGIIIGYIALFNIAKAIMSNPDPEAKRQQEEDERNPKPKKTTYKKGTF